MPRWRRITTEEAAQLRSKGLAETRNVVVDQDSGDLAEAGDESESKLGFAARSIGGAIGPLLGGRAIGAGAGALLGGSAGLAGGPAAPATVPLGVTAGVIGGNILGGLATSYGQEAILKGIANRYPSSAIADFQRRREGDIQAHPYASMLTSLGASPAGGGGLMTIPSTLKRAAQMGGLQAGIDLPLQYATTGEYDPMRGLIAAGSGAFQSTPNRSIRNLERKVTSAIPGIRGTSFEEHFAPRMAPEKPQVDAVDAVRRSYGQQLRARLEGEQIPAAVEKPSTDADVLASIAAEGMTVAKPAVPAEPTIAAAQPPPLPEALASQLADLAAGKRYAIPLSATDTLAAPEGTVITETTKGKILHDKTIKPELIKIWAKNDQLGSLYGPPEAGASPTVAESSVTKPASTAAETTTSGPPKEVTIIPPGTRIEVGDEVGNHYTVGQTVGDQVEIIQGNSRQTIPVATLEKFIQTTGAKVTQPSKGPLVPTKTKVVFESDVVETTAFKHNQLQNANPDKSYMMSNDGKQVLEVLAVGRAIDVPSEVTGTTKLLESPPPVKAITYEPPPVSTAPKLEIKQTAGEEVVPAKQPTPKEIKADLEATAADPSSGLEGSVEVVAPKVKKPRAPRGIVLKQKPTGEPVPVTSAVEEVPLTTKQPAARPEPGKQSSEDAARILAELEKPGSTAPQRGSIGSGIKAAMEKGKKSGSIINPLPAVAKKARTFVSGAARTLRDRAKLGLNPTAKINPGILLARLRNTASPTEVEIAERAGLREFLALTRTPEELATWMDEKTAVDTVVYGMEGKVSEAKKEYDKMTHEWYETLPQNERYYVRDLIAYGHQEGGEAYASKENGPVSKATQEKAQQYIALEKQVEAEPENTGGPRATSAYSHVSALPTNEPMPEWTATKSSKNVQRVDVVIPQPMDRMTYEEWRVKEGGDARGYPDSPLTRDRYELAQQSVKVGLSSLKRETPLWTPDNLHENLPNTLGWAMIQYKTGPKGEKIAVIAEAQSRWGQKQREYNQETEKQAKDMSQEEATQWRKERKASPEISDNPLLKDYNRLILKAAVEQARKEGATHIMISDAETAMMTEGHDTQGPGIARSFPTREGAVQYAKDNNILGLDGAVEVGKGRNNTWVVWDKNTISQEPGMRMNYDPSVRIVDKDGNAITDKTFPTEADAHAWARSAAGGRLKPTDYDAVRGQLHQIAEELTGVPGERISLGEHKNAVEVKIPSGTDRFDTPDTFIPRKNLVFRNPDGTPKIDVTGRIYPLNKVVEQFTLTGADRAPKIVMKPASSIGAGMQRAIGKQSEAGAVRLPSLGDIKAGVKRVIGAPFKAGEYLGIKQLYAATKGSVQRKLATNNPLEYRLVKQYEKMAIDAAKQAPFKQAVQDMKSDLSSKEIDRISDYLYAKKHNQPSDIKPTEKELEHIATHREIEDTLGMQKAMGAYITDFDSKGNRYDRPFQFSENYATEAMNPRARRIINNATAHQEEYNALKRDFVQFQEQQGRTPELAAKIFEELKTPVLPDGTPNPEFKGNRFALGIGLPKSMRMNAIDALDREISRHFQDYAWHKNIESDPQLAKGLGRKDMGRNNPVPEEVLDDAGQPIESGILQNEDTSAMLKDYLGYSNPKAQAIEKTTSAIVAPLVSTWSAVRDVASVFSIVGEHASVPQQVRHALPAIADAFNKAVKHEAMTEGAIRARGNASMTVLDDAEDGIKKILDTFRTGTHRITGTERITQGLRQFAYAFGKRIATDKLLSGDEKFLERWGPLNWREEAAKDPGALTRYMAARLVGDMQGTYGAEGLPNWALKSGDNPVLQYVAPLARWSIERFNRWYRNVYEPAKDGNVGPLLKTLTGAMFITTPMINYIKEQITDAKPREMTWEEYLKLGGKDTAYELFSRAETAGYGGILSSLAFNAIRKLYGETPQGFGQPAFQLGSDILERASQWGQHWRNGEADISDIPTYAAEAALQQVQILRMLNTQKPTGEREENIARRVGVLPPEDKGDYGVRDPLSMSGAYRSNDHEKLAKIFRKRIDSAPMYPTRNPLPRPTSAVRPDPNYYRFIEQLQGPEAARAAMERDKDTTMRKREIFQRAAQDATRR